MDLVITFGLLFLAVVLFILAANVIVRRRVAAYIKGEFGPVKELGMKWMSFGGSGGSIGQMEYKATFIDRQGVRNRLKLSAGITGKVKLVQDNV